MEKIYIYHEYKLENGIPTEIPGIEEIERGNFSRALADEIKSYLQDTMEKYVIASMWDNVEMFTRGSTSVCYHSERGGSARYIYKEFCPYGMDLEPVLSRRDKTLLFCWLTDTASGDQYNRFLMRFVRFINQSKIISQIKHEAEENEVNQFINPTLLLTSKGLVWRMEHLYGNTLLEELKEIGPQDFVEHARKWLLKRMEMILKMSESVQMFFHKEEKDGIDRIFHGDIKPENFLKIKLDRSDAYLIRNIDFDTCTSAAQIQEGYLDRFMATTKIFYDQKVINNLLYEGSTDFNQWAALDVQALAKVLMLALSFDTKRFYYQVQTYLSSAGSCDWFTYFKRNEYPTLFQAMGARDSLEALFVANELHAFLRRCSDVSKPQYRIKTVKAFIAGLKNVLNLMRYLIGEKCEFTPEVIRCAGLRNLSQVKTDEEFTIEDRVDKILKSVFIS